MNYTRTSTLCGPPGCMKKQTRGPVAYPGNKGFITAKQASFNVGDNMSTLNKYAAAARCIRRQRVVKKAGWLEDEILGYVGDSAAGTVGVPSALGGLVHGILAEPTFDEIKSINASPAKSLIPGIGTSRGVRRRRVLRNALAKKPGISRILSERLSPYAALLTSVGVGAGIGGALSENTSHGVGIGALGGGAVGLGATGIGALLGLFRRRRTLAEQKAYEDSKLRGWAQLLVPGLAAHDRFRSLKATRHMDNKSEEEFMKEVAEAAQNKY